MTDDTHTVTTTIDADALALPAGVRPTSVRVGGAVGAGALPIAIAGAEL